MNDAYNLSRSVGILRVKEALPSSSCVNTRNTIGLFYRKSLYYQEYFLCPALPSGNWVRRRIQGG